MSRKTKDMGQDNLIEDIVPHHDAIIRETPHVAHGEVADSNPFEIVRQPPPPDRLDPAYRREKGRPQRDGRCDIGVARACFVLSAGIPRTGRAVSMSGIYADTALGNMPLTVLVERPACCRDCLRLNSRLRSLRNKMLATDVGEGLQWGASWTASS